MTVGALPGCGHRTVAVHDMHIGIRLSKECCGVGGPVSATGGDAVLCSDAMLGVFGSHAAHTLAVHYAAGPMPCSDSKSCDKCANSFISSAGGGSGGTAGAGVAAVEAAMPCPCGARAGADAAAARRHHSGVSRAQVSRWWRPWGDSPLRVVQRSAAESAAIVDADDHADDAGSAAKEGLLPLSGTCAGVAPPTAHVGSAVVSVGRHGLCACLLSTAGSGDGSREVIVLADSTHAALVRTTLPDRDWALDAAAVGSMHVWRAPAGEGAGCASWAYVACVMKQGCALPSLMLCCRAPTCAAVESSAVQPLRVGGDEGPLAGAELGSGVAALAGVLDDGQGGALVAVVLLRAGGTMRHSASDSGAVLNDVEVRCS